jgi:hypothetical protein
MSDLSKKMFIMQSQGMGGGDPELAQKMMRGFLKMLGKQKVKPNSIFFLGDSVKLLLKDSPVLELLKILETQGVELLICKAAVEFFEIEKELAIGKIISTGIWMEKLNQFEVVTF